MKSRRTATITMALLLAVVAFLGNMWFLRDAEERAYGKAKLVQVYQVEKEIAKGTKGDDVIASGAIRAARIPQEFRPGTAINDIDDIRGKIAVNGMAPGQVVVIGQFDNPENVQVTFAQNVPQGQVAISVQVDPVRGVSGVLRPGDTVNILALGKDSKGTEFVRTLYQNVKIMAIGGATTTAKPKEGDDATAAPTVTSNLVTFVVPLDAAQRIVLASSGTNGSSIYLALTAPNGAPVPTPGQLDSGGLYSGLPQTPYPNS